MQRHLIPVFGMIFMALACSPSFAASSPPTKACPLASNDIKAQLLARQYQGPVGLPVLVKLVMNPTEPPPGFYYSALVDVLQAPRGPEPEVLTGVPEISVKCFTPGRYLLRVRVNLIAKSSCGGAKATILMEDEVALDISKKGGS